MARREVNHEHRRTDGLVGAGLVIAMVGALTVVGDHPFISALLGAWGFITLAFYKQDPPQE